MSYQVRRGDTLWALSRRYGTSISALMKANPAIKNANLIYVGEKLNIPGSHDSFQPAKKPAAPKPAAGRAPAAHPGPASAAFAIARSELGKNAGSLKLESSAVGRAMEDWVPNNVNCASFVSGCLQAAGQITHHDYSAGSVQLMHNLDKNPHFKRVSLANASPGDVITFSTGGGGHHTVMFAGMKDGRPVYIGSNNVNSDGSQRITMGHMGYSIMAIQHYVG